MSNINTDNIDTSYPVAGRDNDSTGFRTNFSAIAVGLETAKTEIEELQSKAVLKSKLVDDLTLDNDMGGNVVFNGTHKQFYPAFWDDGQTEATTTINVDMGSVQKFTVIDTDASGGETFTFDSWRSSAEEICSSVRLIFTAHSSVTGTRTVNFTGNIVKETNFPVSLTVEYGKIKVVDAWTIDGGTTVYMNYIGEF